MKYLKSYNEFATEEELNEGLGKWLFIPITATLLSLTSPADAQVKKGNSVNTSQTHVKKNDDIEKLKFILKKLPDSFESDESKDSERVWEFANHEVRNNIMKAKFNASRVTEDPRENDPFAYYQMKLFMKDGVYKIIGLKRSDIGEDLPESTWNKYLGKDEVSTTTTTGNKFEEIKKKAEEGLKNFKQNFIDTTQDLVSSADNWLKHKKSSEDGKHKISKHDSHGGLAKKYNLDENKLREKYPNLGEHIGDVITLSDFSSKPSF